MIERLTIRRLHDRIGITPDTPGYGEVFGSRSRAALFAALSNKNAPGLTAIDFLAAAARLGVPMGHIKGVRTVEAPRGPYDDMGRPSILFERHKFRAATVPPGRFDEKAPLISGGPYGPGGYGAFSGQYDKLVSACALDPEAALQACSWGAFQVMGGNAVSLGYASAFDMAISLTTSEAAHLETFVRYVEVNHLTDELRACRPNDPESCKPFTRAYNGPQHERFDYPNKFAKAIA